MVDGGGSNLLPNTEALYNYFQTGFDEKKAQFSFIKNTSTILLSSYYPRSLVPGERKYDFKKIKEKKESPKITSLSQTE